MLRQAIVTVHLHDTIETKGLAKEDVPTLRERRAQNHCSARGRRLATSTEDTGEIGASQQEVPRGTSAPTPPPFLYEFKNKDLQNLHFVSR